MSELDSFGIKDLEVRYSLARSNIYNRINGLKKRGHNLEPEMREGKSVYSANQIAVLDALDRHLKNGGTTSTFPTPEQLSYAGQDNSQLSYVAQDTPVEIKKSAPGFFQNTLTFDLVQPILSGIEKILSVVFPPPLPPARKGLELAPYRELNEAAKEGYKISTTNLANLLGLRTSTVANYGDEFEDAGFVFKRAGRRKGGQIAWAVSKPPAEPIQPQDSKL